MSHWQQQPIRYLQSFTPQPSQTIKSLKRKIQQYQIRLKQQEQQAHRFHIRLQQKELRIKYLEHQNKQLRAQLEYQSTIPKRVDESMIDLGNINEAEYNVRNRINPNSIKLFRVQQLKHGGRSNRSFEREHSVRRSIVESSLKGSIQQVGGRQSTPPIKSVGKSKNKSTVFKIFQSFIVVQGNLQQIGQNTIEPKIALSYPEHQPGDRQKIVPMFCYPRGVKSKVLTTQQELNQILSDVQLESSIFLLNSQYTTTAAQESRVKNDVVSIANPNFNLYGVCLKGKVVAQMGNTNFQLSKTYVILTYLPFVRFFLNLLAMTINAIKTQQMNTPIGVTPDIQKVVIRSFEDLSRISINKLPMTIKFRCQGNNLNLSIPQPPYTDSLTSSYAIHCISKIDVDILVDIILLMLIQYSIVIHSKDATLLSQLVLLLMQCIRPLRYPHPVIVNLPKQMEMMLESPFPTLIGITVPLTHLEPNSVYFNIDARQIQNKPDIASLVYLGDYLKSVLRNKKADNDILNRIKLIIGEQIISSTIKNKQSAHKDSDIQVLLSMIINYSVFISISYSTNLQNQFCNRIINLNQKERMDRLKYVLQRNTIQAPIFDEKIRFCSKL